MNTQPVRTSTCQSGGSALCCYPLEAGLKKTKREWASKHNVFLAELNYGGTRHFVRVTPMWISYSEIDGVNEGKDVFMDCVTGTMYDPMTGECYSSDFLKIVAYDEHTPANDSLISKKPIRWGQYGEFSDNTKK